jgi:hypothetical protein
MYYHFFFRTLLLYPLDVHFPRSLSLFLHVGRSYLFRIWLCELPLVSRSVYILSIICFYFRIGWFD